MAQIGIERQSGTWVIKIILGRSVSAVATYEATEATASAKICSFRKI